MLAIMLLSVYGNVDAVLYRCVTTSYSLVSKCHSEGTVCSVAHML